MKVYRIVKGTATNTSLDVTICPVCGVNAGRAKACPACGNIFRP
jgi:rubrerythrin